MTFPASLPSFTNPTSGDNLNTSVGGFTHSAMHAAENDAIEEIAAALGAGSLTVTTWSSPGLTSTGTSPTLGAGSSSGWYVKFGPLFVLNFRYVFGSGATAGTGIYVVTPPFTVYSSGAGGEGSGQAVSSGGVPQAAEFSMFNGTISGMITTATNSYIGASVPTGMGTNGSNFQGLVIGRLV